MSFITSVTYISFIASLLTNLNKPPKEDHEILYAPEESRFLKVVVAEKLDEPMELAVMDDGKVLFIERKGLIKLYDPVTNSTKEAGKLDVYPEHEDGLLGLAIDPSFNSNKFVYLYYAPAGPTSINRLSRFVFQGDQLDVKSEKMILEVPVLRACCHSGGSIEFGPDGNLFLSLGDDTNPFESDNYNPIDERKGRGVPWDAQATSANSNDLRGSIIRITPQADGSYSIPEGNLFPVGTPGTRPEIYVMGNRNPFRISIDQKNGYLYWGEVGPDAGADSLGRGPMGYDEVNQARKAGFFGWPYFIADNKAYWEYDFEKKLSLKQYDAAAPVNSSPNNTGVEKLPSAQKALVWYPYGESKEFPLVGEGGRNAMAGPVFYHDLFEFSDVKFPKYYHGKLFIYDWMRDWIMAVTMNKKGDFERMEPFMPNTVFNKPVDMAFGKDGALYVLEYGTYWNSQNDDARLSRIEYNEGNRKPIAKASVNKTRSAAPATLQFSAKGSFDYDKGDTLSYEWSFDQPGIVQSTEINPAYTFTKPGKYKPALKVKDSEGKESVVTLEVEIGNEPPEVSINFMNNRSFFWHNSPINYEIEVKDKEDGSLKNGTIKPEQVIATMFYLEQGYDQIQAAQGHQVTKGGKYVTGKTLIEASDCKACHAVEKSSVGPSYNEVAKRYNANSGDIDQLTAKIINGGSGNWGDRMMPPHLQLSKEDANEMVQYILSLVQEEQEEENQQIELKGSIVPDKQVNDKEGGAYILTASYTDKGAAGMPPAQGREEILIRHAKVLAANADNFKGTAKANNERSRLIKFTEDQSYIMFKKLDLNEINHLVFAVDPNKTRGLIEVRLDAPDGRLFAASPAVSKADKPARSTGRWFDVTAKTENVQGVHDVYFIFKMETDANSESANIWNSFLLNTIYFGKEKLQ